jgi:hypothetical protein
MNTNDFVTVPAPDPLPPETGCIVFRVKGIDSRAVPFHATTADRASALALEEILKGSPHVLTGSVVRTQTWSDGMALMRGVPPIEQVKYTLNDDGTWTASAGWDTDKHVYQPGEKSWSGAFMTPDGEPVKADWTLAPGGIVRSITVGPDTHGSHRFPGHRDR